MGKEGKSHRKKKTGLKAEKRKKAEQKKKGVLEDAQARRNNPRAFSFQSTGQAKAQRARSAEKEQRRLHAPMLEKTVDEPPPLVVLVQGPPQVGKSTLIKCLVKHYTKMNLSDVLGPITVVAGKKRRITFIECPPDLHGMLDAAKYADLVLLLIDGSFGFEMETFEFLNLLQVHGFPKVMGILTHLDGFQDQKALKKTKKKLKARFWTEIYDGAKLFYLSGIQHGKYLKREVLNLARFISVMKTRPLTWRLAHPYVIADRFEDITARELVRTAPKCDRDVVLYGYLRGANLKPDARVHIAGVGDYTIQELDVLPDPCPLPESLKRRGLNDKDRLLYAPMADVGGMLYDKDAVYIDIPDWKVQYSRADGTGGSGPGGEQEGEVMVRQLQTTQLAVDEKLAASKIRMFQGGKLLSAHETLDSQDPDDDEEDDEDDEGMSGSDDEGGSDAGEGSDWSSDGDDDDGPHAHKLGASAAAGGKARVRPQAVAGSDGRVRRRALFGDDAVDVAAGSEDEEDSEGEEDAQEGLFGRGRRAGPQGSDEDMSGEDEEDGADSDDSEGLGGAAKWKGAMGRNVAALFARRGADLSAYVYGRRAVAVAPGGGGGEGSEDPDGGGLFGDDGGGSSDDDDEDFFKPVKRKTEVEQANDLEAQDALDSSRVLLAGEALGAWEDDDTVQTLRNRFVTGDWDEGGKRAAAKPDDGAGSDEEGAGGSGAGEDGEDEVFGDFEDVETGQRFTGGAGSSGGGDDDDPALAAAKKAIAEATAEELRAKKAAKKAAFDSAYDTKGPKGADNADGEGDEEGGAGPKAKKAGGREEKEETFYDSQKREMVERAAKTRAALDALTPTARVSLEGYRPGAYVRMRFKGMPYELVAHHDPCHPLLIGGLGQGEEKLGMMKIRLKRHRWFPKVLKARDPLVFSMGWRRFQSLPVYALEDHNRRLRMLKYTPEHMHCMTALYGPLAPQNTGVVAIQHAGDNVKGWRVSATGVVLELDADLRVVKKLKLVGTPARISRHTAFISGMFTSQLEAAKFEGASIRTVSGIRGTIKKAVRPGGLEKFRDGTFRATFEDKILLSDVVFLRAWVALELPRFYNPVTNLLSAQVKPVRELKPAKKKAAAAKAAAEAAAGADGARGAHAAAAGPGPLSSALAKPLLGAGGSGALATGAGAAAASGEFTPAARFAGPKPGQVFKLGPQGLGYYKDLGPKAAAQAAAAARAASRAAFMGTLTGAAGAGASGQAGAAGGSEPAGWVGMRTTAALRRELGEGAPRLGDSLYRDIERAPRTFNPLKVPKALQAALPFKTKPKLEAARKGGKKSLEQRRAVVLEPGERRAATLLQQLNAIRNDKAAKRRDQQARRGVEKAKKAAKEEAWRGQLNKERRKDRYREQGQAEKRKAMAAEGGGRMAKKARKKERD